MSFSASDLRSEITGLLDTSIWITNLANVSAAVMAHLPRVNWAGFYLLSGDELVLGPFQGLPACLRIPLGKGVCGTAARDRRTLRVPDVDKFPGHIACDSRSRSEIVVPLILGDRLLGVMDVDSPELGRFSDADRALLEWIAGELVARTDWPDKFV